MLNAGTPVSVSCKQVFIICAAAHSMRQRMACMTASCVDDDSGQIDTSAILDTMIYTVLANNGRLADPS